MQHFEYHGVGGIPKIRRKIMSGKFGRSIFRAEVQRQKKQSRFVALVLTAGVLLVFGFSRKAGERQSLRQVLKEKPTSYRDLGSDERIDEEEDSEDDSESPRQRAKPRKIKVRFSCFSS